MTNSADRDGLGELERKLREWSHNIDALKAIQDFSRSLKKTRVRQGVFNAEGALIVRPPISYEEGRKRGLIPDDEDEFTLLQGDIVRLESAYHLGERLQGMQFLVASSTCDLVPGRRRFAALLPVQPILPGETLQEQEATKRQLSELLLFTSTRRMYLPLLPGDSDDVIGNAIEFDRIAQARLNDVLSAERVASLSLVGWRIFASHLRAILSRTSEGEVHLREEWSAPE